MKIYVASSWRNQIQQGVVAALREDGHDVYDFKNPAPRNHGFSWSAIDPNWQSWTAEQFIAALEHPVAVAGYKLDDDALRGCDVCVLVLPSGRSAHIEAGVAIGAGKPTAILLGQNPSAGHSMSNEPCIACFGVDSSMRGFAGACLEPERQKKAVEPELMYREASLVTDKLEAVQAWAKKLARPKLSGEFSLGGVTITIETTDDGYAVREVRQNAFVRERHFGAAPVNAVEQFGNDVANLVLRKSDQ